MIMIMTISLLPFLIFSCLSQNDPIPQKKIQNFDHLPKETSTFSWTSRLRVCRIPFGSFFFGDADMDRSQKQSESVRIGGINSAHRQPQTSFAHSVTIYRRVHQRSQFMARSDLRIQIRRAYNETQDELKMSVLECVVTVRWSKGHTWVFIIFFLVLRC